MLAPRTNIGVPAGVRVIVAGMKATAHPRAATLLLAIDLVGTGLFAAEGASMALNARLDLLGVLVIAVVTATGGGIIRDVLLGDTPPSSVRDWRYFFTALVAGAGVFLLHSATHFENLSLITLLDAAGLSFFAVAGAAKAVQFGLHPLLCIMMGGITAVGGGALRDVLINRVPIVLRGDVYATAALLGAAVTVTCLRLKLHPAVASSLGIVSCFVLRMMAVHFHWNLPGAVPADPV
jgi:uncharacterized membrane protein YeiH